LLAARLNQSQRPIIRLDSSWVFGMGLPYYLALLAAFLWIFAFTPSQTQDSGTMQGFSSVHRHFLGSGRQAHDNMLSLKYSVESTTLMTGAQKSNTSSQAETVGFENAGQ
jgi:hypothetical protein